MVEIITVFNTLASSLLYRLGGMGKAEKDRYFPFLPDWAVEKIVRKAGCTALNMLWMLLFYRFPAGTPEWQMVTAHLISGGLFFGAITTYWDRVPFNDGKDNFWMHGAGIGLAALPFAIVGGCWIAVLVRSAALCVFMGILCKHWSNVWVEECGRGGAIPASNLSFIWL